MNIDRLMLLAHHLEALAAQPVKKRKRKFDMYAWWNSAGSCGTSACAGGEATQIPALREAGLRLRLSGSHGNYVLRFVDRATGGDKYGRDALAAVFGIPIGVVNHLFLPSSYRTAGRTPRVISPQRVADRIRAVVATVDAVAARMQPE